MAIDLNEPVKIKGIRQDLFYIAGIGNLSLLLLGMALLVLVNIVAGFVFIIVSMTTFSGVVLYLNLHEKGYLSARWKAKNGPVAYLPHDFFRTTSDEGEAA